MFLRRLLGCLTVDHLDLTSLQHLLVPHQIVDLLLGGGKARLQPLNLLNMQLSLGLLVLADLLVFLHGFHLKILLSKLKLQICQLFFKFPDTLGNLQLL